METEIVEWREPGSTTVHRINAVRPGVACAELGITAIDHYFRLVSDEWLNPHYPDGPSGFPMIDVRELETLRNDPEFLNAFNQVRSRSEAQDYEEDDLTPSEACRELNLRVDDLMCLVLEGHYLPEAGPNDLCWPVAFKRDRIKALKADPELLAAFRSSLSPPGAWVSGDSSLKESSADPDREHRDEGPIHDSGDRP